MLVFGAAALFVFLVLAAKYESWKLPLAVVLIVPMCLLASVTGLSIRGMPMRIASKAIRISPAWISSQAILSHGACP